MGCAGAGGILARSLVLQGDKSIKISFLNSVLMGDRPVEATRGS